jgi:predicted O-linked N-acetylglucosamine transferase (SPINDLY family)/glycosyltransferase involved in cell wall biosynthesis
MIISKANFDNHNLPLVSICIPLYNKVKYIEQTLVMALAQTYLNLEIVVNDNGSTDGSDLVVKKCQSLDSRIKYYRLDHTIPTAENWRYTLLLAKGDYLHLLCADDCIAPNFIQEMMMPLLNNEKIDFTCCKLEPLFEEAVELDFIQKVEIYFEQVNSFNQELLNLSNEKQKLEKIATVCSYANYFGSIIGVVFKHSCLPIESWNSHFNSLGCNPHPDWNFLARLHSNYKGSFINKSLAQFSYNYSGAALNQNKSFDNQAHTAGGDFLIPFTMLADPTLSKIRECMSSELISKVKSIAQQNLEKAYGVAENLDRHNRSNTKIVKTDAKHILVYTDDPGIYGVAQYNHAIIKGLVTNGYRVSCVQARASHHLVDERKSLGIEHFWLESADFAHSLNNEAEAKRLINKIQPDLVLFSNCCPISNFAAKRVAIELNTPYLVIEGFVGEYLADRFSDYIPELGQHYQQARQVISVSNENKQLLQRRFNLDVNHGQTIYYGKPAEYFQPINLSNRDRLRQEFDIPDDAVVCFTAARMEIVKGYQYQLEAIAQLKDTPTWQNLCFVWAGDGSLLSQIQQSIDDLGVSDRVKLLGARSDIEICLDMADIFILTSQLEGMPHAIMEAMAKGLPVIASSVSGIPEELGSTGKLLPDPTVNVRDTITELVDTLHLWVQDASLRQELGSACKEKALELFTEDRMISETLEVVKYVLSPTYLEDKLNHNLLIAELRADIDEYHHNSDNLTICERLSNIRKELFNTWLNLAHTELPLAYQGLSGQQHRLLVDANLPEIDFDEEIKNALDRDFNHPQSVNYLLAGMLSKPAYQLPITVDLAEIPDWLQLDYLAYLLTPPVLFTQIGETDRYYQYLSKSICYLHAQILSHPNEQFWQKVAEVVTYRLNCISLYFNSHNLKDIYKQRAEIIEFHLKSKCYQLEYEFSERSPERNKIRIGILASHYSPQTETFTTLPFYQHLNRDIFEIVLYTLNDSNHRLHRYCAGHADAMVVLPNDLSSQSQIIRSDDLDLLLIATNITAVTNSIALLATHRLARIQCVNNSCCVTTGFKNTDYYLSGKLTEIESDAQSQYIEKLLCIDGSAHCREEATEANSLATITVDRASLGLAEDDLIYISGANFFKITPELELIWAKILKQQPQAKLLLYPFNPNWSNHYPINAFKQRIKSAFLKSGIEENRLLILEPVANFADVKARLAIADVYLDSFPFSSINSLIDPLEVGLPIVIRNGNNFRSLMGAALMQILEIPDLITDSDDSYIQLAIDLGNNPKLCQQKSTEIKSKMHDNPSFLDSKGYGAKIGELFKELFDRYSANTLSDNLRLRDVNLMVFPDWSQSEESVGLELQQVIQTLATQPDSQKTTLLIDTTNIAIEDAEMFLSSVAMNLMMEEDLDITEELEISLIEDLSNIQWDKLLPRIDARIILECDNQAVVGKLPQEKLLQRQLESFIVN